MSRTAVLKPAFRSARNDAGLASWVVNVPSHLSPTGKRQELFFSTKSDAGIECEKLKARKDNFGLSLSAMTPARIAEAAECYRLLGSHAISLTDAVRGFLAAYKARTESISFLALFNLYLAAKSDRNAQYLRELRITRDRFPTLYEHLVSDISHRDLEPLLNAISPGGRNPVMRYLRAVFFFGIKRGYLAENPISRLDFADRPRKEVEIIPSDKVQAMLTHALENDLRLLPYLLFGFFAGIRPDGELKKLEWGDVKLAEGTIVIRPEVSKTNRRRFPKISENAAAWIEAYRRRGGTFEGRVSPYTDSELRERRKANWTAAGIIRWVQQGMRHTYCTCWLALYKDINELVLQSGHDSVDTMWRNYHKGVPEAEAEKFWSIMPPSSAEGKIIPLIA